MPGSSEGLEPPCKRSHGLKAPEDAMQRVCPGSGTWMCRGSEVAQGRAPERPEHTRCVAAPTEARHAHAVGVAVAVAVAVAVSCELSRAPSRLTTRPSPQPPSYLGRRGPP